ncbi:MAG: type I methionyl aminopeptidase [Candidatus Izemoplasmatales bacterium]|uniref:Methionine aminopeptidase n=1 Tax=Hujiaoplasma nucleasis TaxID=2725268 RepID=A0A7L6N731_9MOLU|nr:type I methionyl aminopeptidase [Hujiaoplasma nucleasis]QLY40344.1 type I methionyl aminopeptidase [Hujiaoplasma nucleasis]
MIKLKSEREIALMRQAGKIVALAHQAAKDFIKPGISTEALDDLIEKVIRDHDAIPSFKNYNGFPASACISINEEVVHGIPSKSTILKEGDIVSVDIGAIYKGYHGDSAWTYACGEISDDAKRLLKGTEESLFKGLEFAKAGNRLSDISHAIQKYAEGLGFSVVREFVGHGLGSNLHEDPQIPNYGLPGRGPRLKSGMTLAIEPMINLGNKDVKVLADGWTAVTRDKSLSAHFEHSILITDTGYEILTKC